MTGGEHGRESHVRRRRCDGCTDRAGGKGGEIDSKSRARSRRQRNRCCQCSSGRVRRRRGRFDFNAGAGAGTDGKRRTWAVECLSIGIGDASGGGPGRQNTCV
jgi:hypothetical protein